MNDRVEFIDYEKTFSIKVGEFLTSKGLVPASSLGRVREPFDREDSIGILRNDPEAEPPQKKLFGLITIQQKLRREFLGTIYFKNYARGGSERKWIFEVHGHNQTELVKQLAEELASIFNVMITLRVVSNQPEFETFDSDFDL